MAYLKFSIYWTFSSVECIVDDPHGLNLRVSMKYVSNPSSIAQFFTIALYCVWLPFSRFSIPIRQLFRGNVVCVRDFEFRSMKTDRVSFVRFEIIVNIREPYGLLASRLFSLLVIRTEKTLFSPKSIKIIWHFLDVIKYYFYLYMQNDDINLLEAQLKILNIEF